VTPILTAASDQFSGTGLLILAALTGAAAYTFACWIWPFRACTKCGGIGRFRSPTGRAWRPCRRCKGSGAKLRTGRRILTYLTRTHRNSTR
jgi:hypothetical protein